MRNGCATEREEEGGCSDTEPAEEIADTGVEGGQGVANNCFCEERTAGHGAARTFRQDPAIGITDREQTFAGGADDGIAIFNAAHDSGASLYPSIQIIKVPGRYEHDGRVSLSVNAAERGEMHVFTDGEAVGVSVDCVYGVVRSDRISVAAFGRSHVMLLIAGGDRALRREEPCPIYGAFPIIDSDADFQPDAVLQGHGAEMLLPMRSQGRGDERDFFRENDDLSSSGS